MANLRTNNLSGEQGRNAIKGSVVFGGGDDSSAGLTIADNSDLELSSETNWTIEFWLWLNGPTHGDYDVILGKGSATGNNYEYFVEVMSDNTLEFLTTSTGSAWTFQQQISPVLSADSWHHVAVVRNGSGSNSLKSYINGQEYGSFTAESIHTSAYPFGIGYFAGGNNLYSKITLSNLRIVKGTSVYTAAFTPPFEELTAIPNTVLLCCQDSDNPFKEETGKTITGVGHLANGAVIHPKNNPPYGVDAGNTFGGPIQQSSQGYMYFPTGRTEEKGGGIAIVGGGYSAATSPIGTIESIIIQTMGNSKAFGTLNAARFSSGVVASRSRVIFGGGYQPSNLNSMEFVNPITQGNGTDAGDLGAARKMIAGLGNSTRGIFAGGNEPSPVNTIEFVTIPSLGDAVNFGDLTATVNNPRGCASPTRGIINCATAPSSRSNVINFITIASAGDAQDFGDLTETFGMTGFGLSDNTRGVIGGYYTSPSNTHSNVINFVTIATTGDATDFGDMVTGTGHGGSGCSDKTRGVIFGQYSNTPHQAAPFYSDAQGAINLIQMITVQTTGNAVEFGDLVANVASLGRKYYANGNSNSHGGLS